MDSSDENASSWNDIVSGTYDGDESAAVSSLQRFRGCLDDTLQKGKNEERWILAVCHSEDVKAFVEGVTNAIDNEELIKTLVEKFLIVEVNIRERVASESRAGLRGSTSSWDEERRWYERFYPVQELPHFGVLDPRSGERLVVWEGEDISGSGLQDAGRGLMEFIASHDLKANDLGPRHVEEKAGKVSTRRIDFGGSRERLRENVIEDEEMALAAAIEASLIEARQLGKIDGDNAAQPILGTSAESFSSSSSFQRQMSVFEASANEELVKDRLIRKEQDEDFLSALKKDMEKEEAEKTVERIKAVARERLPAEGSHEKYGNVLVVVRLPSGDRVQYRFDENVRWKSVADLVESNTGELFVEEGSMRWGLRTMYDSTLLDDWEKQMKNMRLGKRIAVLAIRLSD